MIDFDCDFCTDTSRREKLLTTIKTSCLPKLICELMSSDRYNRLREIERSLLNMIRYNYFNNTHLSLVSSCLHYRRRRMDRLKCYSVSVACLSK